MVDVGRWCRTPGCTLLPAHRGACKVPVPCPVLTADWDALPRLLSDLCDMGHYREELFRLDYPAGGHTWLCRTCYVPAYITAGRPPQHHRRCDPQDHQPTKPEENR